jgi:hypothetical protein
MSPDGDEPLLRLEDFGGELVRLAQRELRVDDQHVALAREHRRVDVVADLPPAGVHLQRERRLRGARPDQHQREHHADPQSACPHVPPLHTMRFRGVVRPATGEFRATKGLSLGDFIIKPVQRLCKYPLLLRELINCTDPHSPDHRNLVVRFLLISY